MKHINLICNHQSLIKFIILIDQYKYINYTKTIYIVTFTIYVQKKCSNKNDYLLTFESQKLNYFGKKGGPAFWHYNVIRIGAMSGPFSRFLVIFYPLSPCNVPHFKNVFQHTFISANNRVGATSKYVNKLTIGFYFCIPEVKQYGQS